MQARSLPEPYRSVARRFARVARRGRTAIRLGFSREPWRFLFRYVNSIARGRSAAPASQVVKKVREEKRKLSTLMLFLVGDFRAAMDQALGDLEARPDDAETRLLVVGCAIELGDFECAEHHMSRLEAGRIPDVVNRQLPFFRYTLTKQREPDNPELAVRHLDDLYLATGCRPIRMSRAGRPGVFDSLTTVTETVPPGQDGYRPRRDGPLVSIVMTAYNVEPLVGTAVMSILNQGYRNLELIVVDDCSSDGTLEALRRMAGEDERMRVVSKDRNDGTYVSKNVGLLQASGKYVAFQDSDDWSHPDRLGKSVAVLESRPDLVAVTTNWVRLTTDGELILQNKNHYSYRACISMVFRREEMLQRLGFFDSVRAEGDGEFEIRIKILFGEERIVNFPWPLCFGRVRPGSITANEDFGLVRGRGRPVREEYRKAYKKWHEKIGDEHDGYMPFPLRERPFEAPGMILSDAGRRAA